VSENHGKRINLTSPDTTYPRWMKLKEAAWYSNIGKQRLIQLAQDGHIKGFQDPDSGRGDWIFCRYSIDEYRESQIGDLRKKALEIYREDLL
jgi:hypothetical protein